MSRLLSTPRSSLVVLIALDILALAPERADSRAAAASRRTLAHRESPALAQDRATHSANGLVVPAVAAPAKALGDTFYLFGGVGTLTGKFQTVSLLPDRQGWQGVDGTEVLPHWHVSDFNAANLGAPPPYWSGGYSIPPLNHAMWDGVVSGTAGYASAPGYGNSWRDLLDRRFTVTSTAVSTSLSWNFVFNHDSEPGYDFFSVQWDSAGTMVELASFDADNRDTAGQFSTPASFSAAIVYSPGMYAGLANNQVHLRLRFDSDGAWSDEDGLWPTDGAVQVDNIQVNGNNGVGLSQATFESGANGGWAPVPDDFAGDFSKVFPLIQAIDLCVADETPQMTFIDDGTPPANDPLARSTGGSTSSTWSYGVPGGWVFNYTGGLTLGEVGVDNEVWSPAIAWDLPGTADDVAQGGAFLRLNVWEHLPLLNAIFWQWHVRSFPDPDTGDWSPWRDRNFVYYSESARYSSLQMDVADLLVPEPSSVQIALRGVDLAGVFFFPGNDATPSPLFDDIAFAKYLSGGPAITVREIDLFQDGFPASGAWNYKDGPADMVVRVDMARSIRPNASPGVVPGDSMVADVVPTLPGTSLAGNPTLHWFLAANTAFDAVRTLPPGAVSIGLGLWTGTVVGDTARTASGAPVANRFFFDLPDGPAIAPYQSDEPSFFFPGDLLRYYLRAQDTGGHVTLLPADTTDFTRAFAALPKASSVCPRPRAIYSSTYETNALPSIWVRFTEISPKTATSPAVTDTQIHQPPVLIWNDLGPGQPLEELELAFYQNGMWRAEAFDVYNTWGPTSGVSNGLGAAGAHGANAQQLSGYSCLFYESGNLPQFLICDGSGVGGNDKSNDVGVLTAWFGQANDRAAAYFGDDIGAGLSGGGITYRDNILRIAFVGTDVRPAIGGQTTPRVAPTAAGVVRGFSTQYVAFGGCPGINDFDNIQPGSTTGTVRMHEFLTPAGTGGAYAPAAGVYAAWQDTVAAQPYNRVNATFPYGFLFIRDVIGGGPPPGGRSARANLVRELMIAFGHSALLDTDITGDPPIPRREFQLSQNAPNPFNPSTQLQLMVPERGHVTVRVYNLRGQLVDTLIDEVVDPATLRLSWDGHDSGGRPVASGVYLVEARGLGHRQIRKMALLR